MRRHPTLKIYPTGGIDCFDYECPSRMECSNHCTAGDFRTEDGLRPSFGLLPLPTKRIAEIKAICFGLSKNSGAGIIREGKVVHYDSNP